MDKQVQQLLKDKDLQGALEILKLKDNNAGLILADYLNEKKIWKQKYMSDEAWQAYTGELLMRIIQLCEENESKSDAPPIGQTGKFKDMAKVFISYSTKDIDIVNRIARYLEVNHFDYYVDFIKLEPGEVIKSKLTQEIIERDYFVVLLSKNSLRSSWVCMESTISNAKEINSNGWAIPVQLDGSIDNIDFLVDVQQEIKNSIDELDKQIDRSRKYSTDHKFIDTQRQRQVEFGNNYGSMVDRYKNKRNIKIYDEFFENGMKELIATIQRKR